MKKIAAPVRVPTSKKKAERKLTPNRVAGKCKSPAGLKGSGNRNQFGRRSGSAARRSALRRTYAICGKNADRRLSAVAGARRAVRRKPLSGCGWFKNESPVPGAVKAPVARRPVVAIAVAHAVSIAEAISAVATGIAAAGKNTATSAVIVVKVDTLGQAPRTSGQVLIYRRAGML